VSPDLELSADQLAKRAQDAVEDLKREGLKAGVVEEWEDCYRTAAQPDAFEWWYFDAQFDNGWTAVLAYSTKPMTKPHAALKPSVQIILHDPEGNRRRLSPTFKGADLVASAETCDVRIGPNLLRGNLDHYVLHAEADDGTVVDLKFDRGAPSWRPGAGFSYFDAKKAKYMAWVVPIPYGTVEGTLTVDGKSVPVKGTGYHDHNWGNVSPGLGIDHWYWGRAHVGDFSLIFVQIVTAKAPVVGSLKLPVFFMARGDEIIIEDGLPLSLVTDKVVDGPHGRTYPTELTFNWSSDDGTVELAITNPKLIETIDVIEDMRRWQQALIHLFANPTYYDFNADLELTVDYKGIKATEKGRALYEIMMLR